MLPCGDVNQIYIQVMEANFIVLLTLLEAIGFCDQSPVFSHLVICSVLFFFFVLWVIR